MTEKRYYVHKYLFQGDRVHDKICHNFMNIDETVEHLNNEYWKYKQLKNENEYLKKELKRCKDWINSDKNDYELTLSFIKNKGYSLKDVLEYEKELKNK